MKWKSEDGEENWILVGHGGDEELIELIFTENNFKGLFGWEDGKMEG